MNLTKRSVISAGIVLTLLCAACDPKTLRRSREAAHRIQVTVDAATDTLTTLHSKGIVSDAQTRRIAIELLRVNDANRVLIAHAKAAKVDDSATRAQLLSDLQLVIGAVNDLKATGILGIKSETGSLAFESAINAMNTSIEILKGALQ